MTQAPLFWRWQAPPSPIRQSGALTMTQSEAGYRVIWHFDNIHARGGAAMIDKLWKDLTYE